MRTGTDAKPDPQSTAIYVRVSTDQQGDSLKSQLKRCKWQLRAWGYEDADIDQVRLYEDQGFSGKDLDRPGFQELLAAIRKGRVDVLVFTELSRVSRSTVDFLGLTHLFAQHGVRFVSLKEKFDTTTPHGKLIMTVLMALNEFEREQTAQRTRLNMHARALRGLWNGGRTPIGYAIDRERTGHLIVVPSEASIVRCAFGYYLEMGSIPSVVDALTRDGYRRPDDKRIPGRGHPSETLTWGVVRNMLSNPTYIGMKEVNRKNKGLTDDEMEALPEQERYQTVEAVWEPIIEKSEFDEVQYLLDMNGVSHNNTIAPRRHNWILQGLLRCDDCGAVLQGESAKRNQYAYYRHRPGTNTSGCNRKRWSAPKVEAAVIERLGRLAVDKPLLDRIAQAANDRITAGLPGLRAHRDEALYRANIMRSDQRRMAQLLLLADGNVPSTFWDEVAAKESGADVAEREAQKLERQIEALSDATVDVDAYRALLSRFSESFEHLSISDRRALLFNLIDILAINADMEVFMLLCNDVWEPPNEKRSQEKYPATSSWLPRRSDKPTRILRMRRGFNLPHGPRAPAAAGFCG